MLYSYQFMCGLALTYVHTGMLQKNKRKKKKYSILDPNFPAQDTRLPRKDPTNRNIIPYCI